MDYLQSSWCFFFQAEDGIRDIGVTGVQTCALPILLNGSGTDSDGSIASYLWTQVSGGAASLTNANTANLTASGLQAGSYVFRLTVTDRSEERRVGKECRSRWSPYH